MDQMRAEVVEHRASREGTAEFGRGHAEERSERPPEALRRRGAESVRDRAVTGVCRLREMRGPHEAGEGRVTLGRRQSRAEEAAHERRRHDSETRGHDLRAARARFEDRRKESDAALGAIASDGAEVVEDDPQRLVHERVAHAVGAHRASQQAPAVRPAAIDENVDARATQHERARERLCFVGVVNQRDDR